jgi:DeoR/GlpR family transcriptional regulator of sugar metabolism
VSNYIRTRQTVRKTEKPEIKNKKADFDLQNISYSCILLQNIEGLFMDAKTRVKRLFPPERERFIFERLSDGAKSLEDLAEKLGVSTATVRRDLLSLEKRGKIRRVHGGAIRADIFSDEPVFSEKRKIKEKEKDLIAKKAAEFIRNGDSIYLDGGSTTLAICRHLGGKQNLSITTNSLDAAAELTDSGHNLFIVGGKFRPISRTIVGALTRQTIASLHFDTAFLGTIGFTENGISTTDPEEAYTKEIVMKNAGYVVLLADSSKLGMPSFAVSGELEDIDALITDKKPPAKFAKILRKKGIKLIY